MQVLMLHRIENLQSNWPFVHMSKVSNLCYTLSLAYFTVQIAPNWNLKCETADRFGSINYDVHEMKILED